MRIEGLVLRDVDGYQWRKGRLFPKHQKEWLKWGVPQRSQWSCYVLNELTSKPAVDGPKAAKAFSIANFPEGFECYDPFKEQPSLFEIAARLRRFLQHELDLEAILAFANEWGDISNTPQNNGTPVETWLHRLTPVSTIARMVTRAFPADVRNAPGLRNVLRMSTVDAELAYNVSTEASGLQSAMVAIGLQSSLLVQAAEAFTNGWVLRNCSYCYQPIAPEENRTDRKYCCDSCRIQAHKQRRKEAIAMHATGKSLKQIAAKLDTDILTVRRWLKTKKE